MTILHKASSAEITSFLAGFMNYPTEDIYTGWCKSRLTVLFYFLPDTDA